MNGARYPMPYSLEKIASEAVKAAAHPMWVPNDQGNLIPRASPNLAAEMHAYLNPFDNYTTNRLITVVYEFINYLIQRFQMSGWYRDGETAYRFIGFNQNFTNTYDIVVRCG